MELPSYTLLKVVAIICMISGALCGVCDHDKFHRSSCPSSENEYKTKIACLSDLDSPCCWDRTWTGVPNCFFPKTETTASTTTAGATTAVTSSSVTSCAQTDSTRVPDSTTSPTTSAMQEIAKINENRHEAEPAELTEIVDGRLSTSESTTAGRTIMGEILAAANNVYEARSNQTNKPEVTSWMDFFDNLLLYPDLKTEKNSEAFLGSASNILLDHVNASTNQNSVVSVVNHMENYAVSMTTSLLGDVESEEKSISKVLNLPYTIITACHEGVDLAGCDVVNDDVTASIVTPNDRGYVTSVTYNSSLNFGLLQGQNYDKYVAFLGSSLFSVTSHDGVNGIDETNVEMTFQQLPNNNSQSTICAFIDSSSGNWSESGCIVTSQNATQARCNCNHNTSFALLFLHTDIEFTEAEESYFEVITYIGCGTSITALMLTVFSFLYLRLTRIKRVVLHLNLAITLCLGQIILLIGTRIDVGTVQCKVVAILLHFFFMSSFSWMLMEGILLYFQSVRAVKGGVNFNLMLVFGWVLPLVIVGISLAISYDGYGSDRGCWLSIHNGLTWAFIGPALGFILINVILLAMIVQVFLKLKTNAQSGEWQKTKRSVRAIAVLTPLLGITWLFGALAVNQATKWFLYLFSICNSLQGLAIFILHCLRNSDVRKAFMKKYRRSFHSMAPFFTSISPTSSSGMTYVNTTSGTMATPSMTHKALRN